MIQRPTTFAEIVTRLTPPLPQGAHPCRPLVASAVEVDGAPRPRTAPGSRRADNVAPSRPRPFWVIVHSVTNHGLQLLHDRPLRSDTLTLRITAAGGEVVQIVLSVAASSPNGNLYETSAEFLRAGLEVGRVA